MRRPTHNSTHKSQRFFSNELDHITNYSSKKCKGNQSLRQCEQFKAHSVNDRFKFVFSNKICVNCLSTSHIKYNCSSKRGCGECKKRHRTLLHLQPMNQHLSNFTTEIQKNANKESEPQTTSLKNSSKAVHSIQSHFSQHSGATIISTAVINIVHAGDNFPVRALLDGGS